MKANELRIGNYHLYKITDVNDERKEWWESCVIDIHDLVVLDKEECSNYAPLPLTEEWLLKFGFELTDKQIKQYDKGKLCIEIYKSEKRPNGRTYFNSWAILEEHPKYVHQLQNLYFALTGEELQYA